MSINLFEMHPFGSNFLPLIFLIVFIKIVRIIHYAKNIIQTIIRGSLFVKKNVDTPNLANPFGLTISQSFLIPNLSDNTVGIYPNLERLKNP